MSHVLSSAELSCWNGLFREKPEHNFSLVIYAVTDENALKEHEECEMGTPSRCRSYGKTKIESAQMLLWINNRQVIMDQDINIHPQIEEE